MNYTAEKMTESRTVYTFAEQNRNGERLQAELVEVRPDNRSKSSLPNLWQKHGYTKKRLESYFSMMTYATDEEGVCRGRYNPQEQKVAVAPRSIIFKGNPKPQNKINFDWMLEVTEQNRERLLRECYRRFINA